MTLSLGFEWRLWALIAVVCLQGAVAAGAPSTGEIRGTVVDARGGEALARVKVRLAGTEYEAVTDARGAFTLGGVAPAEYVLNVSTVGYRMIKRPFVLAAGETKEFEIILSPEALGNAESVDVREGPFEVARGESASELRLSGSEAKNLASVLADDPLRAVQSMPGVSSNDDYDSRFSIRGADYNRVGLYLDDILMHAPFHTVETTGATGSLTIFNGDMLDEMALYAGAPPARFADRTAGVLDIHMRDGNRDAVSFRASAGAANAGGILEGPIGKKGSWLVGARKSYLQYILSRASSDPSLTFGFTDVQGRASYNLDSHNTVTVSGIQGFSGLDRSSYQSKLGVNAVMEATNRFTVGNLGWRFTPGEQFLLTTRLAYLRETAEESNPKAQPLGEQRYGEWVWTSNATWAWNASAPMDFGATARRRRGDGLYNQYQSNSAVTRLMDSYNGNSVIGGGFLQQSWNVRHGMLHFAAGSRWDTETMSGATAVSPYASIGYAPFARTRVQLGWGQYAQFPELDVLTSIYGIRSLPPERATHYIAAIEQRLDDQTRIRIEAYDRDDRDLLFRSMYEARVLAGRYVGLVPTAPWGSPLRGYSRGAEIFLQRRSANRLTGWVSYSLAYTRLRDGVTHNVFPSDTDQRHTVNVYGSYRLSPTLNISAKWLYGSGFPVPGYFRRQGSQFYLDSQRNQARLGDYQRTDVRVNKAWAKDRWKITLYGEVVNLTNADNHRFDAFNGYDTRTGVASVTLNKLFPILPSAGVVFER